MKELLWLLTLWLGSWVFFWRTAAQPQSRRPEWLYGAGMVQPARRWPPEEPDGGDNTTLPPADLYKVAVDEYRFQAQFNWSRTQYLLVFNAAALAAAAALIQRSAIGSALVFGLGAVASVASLFAIRTQHSYYRAARDRMRRVEDYVKIPANLRTDTTTSLGGPRRLVSVNQVITLVFSAIAIADVSGAVVAFL